MEVHIPGILKIIILKGRGNNHGKTDAYLKVNGKIIRSTAKAYFHGQMEGLMRAIKLMIKNMGLVSFFGKTAKSRSGIGKMVNSTGWESCTKMISS